MAEVSDYSTGRSGGVTVAKPSREYRWRRYALVGVIFGMGIWFLNDGFIAWPKENAAAQKAYPGSRQMHSDLDILLNKGFGVSMPPLSLLFLAWVFFNSRGQYRFDGQTLEVPGHPPVPVKSVIKIDRAKWDRKGIAYVHYQVAGSAKLRVLRLDDFIYDRPPVDAIFKQLEELVEASKTAGVVTPVAPR